MKSNKSLPLLTALFLWCGISFAQEDSLGVIGDNLDLYAVLDAFKEAESMEGFEQTLNDQNSKINNLDLNEDGEIDYIQVHDEGDDADVHAIILRVAMDEGDEGTQDVAVIELEKTKTNEANIQIVGDEDIYGEDYIIEPKNPEELTKRVFAPNLIIVNVWGWRGVRVVFAPGYKRWRSPYYWNHYPRYWKPWRPFHWRAYHGFHAHHHAYYHPVKVRRCGRAHGFYIKKRRHCPKIVHHHHHHKGHKNHNGHKQHNGHKHHDAPKNQNKVQNKPVQKNKTQPTNVQQKSKVDHKNKGQSNNQPKQNQQLKKNNPPSNKQSNKPKNRGQNKKSNKPTKRGQTRSRKK